MKYILSSVLIVCILVGIYIFTKYIYDPKIVYACSEVTKNDPIDVQKLCERLTKRKID